MYTQYMSTGLETGNAAQAQLCDNAKKFLREASRAKARIFFIASPASGERIVRQGKARFRGRRGMYTQYMSTGLETGNAALAC